MKALKTVLLLCPLLLLASCRPLAVEELPREELFSLAIGKMDNQIDLFQIKSLGFERKNRIYMRDGLFFLANGNSAKIMELSSYGDLIFLLYDPASNPPPVSFAGGTSDGLAATRKAVAYPLRQIGELAVDSEKRLYVEDTVSEERQVKDKSENLLLSRLILRFDRHGNLEDFIGQEGVGGTPFPYIDSLYVTERDELVVIGRTLRAWLVYWYSRAGSLLYQLAIDQERLPRLESSPKAVPSVGKLVPDLNRRALYAAIYYYCCEDAQEPSSAIEGYATRIYRINPESGEYEQYFTVPEDAGRRQTLGTQEVEVLPPSYEFLGVNSRGAFFLLRREDTNLFQLLVLDPSGKPAARRHLVMEDSELYFKQVRLSAEGIVYALLGEEFRARIAWWRSDKLLEDAQREGG